MLLWKERSVHPSCNSEPLFVVAALLLLLEPDSSLESSESTVIIVGAKIQGPYKTADSVDSFILWGGKRCIPLSKF